MTVRVPSPRMTFSDSGAGGTSCGGLNLASGVRQVYKPGPGTPWLTARRATPYHHPPAGQHLEPLVPGRTRHYLQQGVQLVPRPIHQPSPIGSIGPDQLYAGLALCSQLFQQQPGPVPVLNVGGMDHHHQQVAQGVCRYAPLAALDLLAGVITPYAARLGSLDTLAVDDGPFDKLRRVPPPALAVPFPTGPERR